MAFNFKKIKINKSKVNKNNKRILLVQRYKLKRDKLKKMIVSDNLSISEKIKASMALHSLPKNSSSTRIRNRCFISGRARGYNRFTGLSRHMFRDLAGNGYLPGIMKSSW